VQDRQAVFFKKNKMINKMSIEKIQIQEMLESTELRIQNLLGKSLDRNAMMMNIITLTQQMRVTQKKFFSFKGFLHEKRKIMQESQELERKVDALMLRFFQLEIESTQKTLELF
jgi:hypothetical protein